MKTNSEHQARNISGQHKNRKRQSERGNALVYVLIAIALFAALSFTLARNTDSNEAGTLSEDRAELYATQLISYAAQAKSSVDQMLFQGIEIDDLDFTLPEDSDFNNDPTIYKVYHPDGGGLIPTTIPQNAKNEVTSSPAPGWYMGRFNNIEWTSSTDQDVLLTAYQIAKPVCERINFTVTGNTSIPAISSGAMSDYLVPDSFDADLTSARCPGCGDYASLCISNTSGSAFAFYSIIAAQ